MVGNAMVPRTTTTTTADQPFDAAVQATRHAPAAQGVGVIADIDIHAAFSGNRGACNPHLARKPLGDGPDLGRLQSCSVVIRRAPAAIATVVHAIDLKVMSRLSAGRRSPRSPPPPTFGCGTTILRVAFDAFPGRTVYHCHILDHEDQGMMGTIEAR